jgi:hypothetical protein
MERSSQSTNNNDDEALLRFLQWNMGSSIDDFAYRVGVYDVTRGKTKEQCLDMYNSVKKASDEKFLNAAAKGCFDVLFLQGARACETIPESNENAKPVKHSKTHPGLLEKLEEAGFDSFFIVCELPCYVEPGRYRRWESDTVVSLRREAFQNVEECHLFYSPDKGAAQRDTTIVSAVHRKTNTPFAFASVRLSGLFLNPENPEASDASQTRLGDEEVRYVLDALKPFAEKAVTIVGCDANGSPASHPARFDLASRHNFEAFTHPLYTAQKADEKTGKQRIIDFFLVRIPGVLRDRKWLWGLLKSNNPREFQVVLDSQEALDWKHREIMENSSHHEPLLGALAFGAS